MGFRSRSGLVTLVCVLVSAHAADAVARELRRSGPIEITADRIVYEVKREVYVAEGSVRVVEADRSLSADWVAFNRTTRRGVASGHVRLEDAGEVIEARFVQFDFDARVGLVLGGRLDMGEDDFKVAAEELRKTGDDTYEVVAGSFSTCRCPEDDDRLPWQVNAADAEIELGGYATAKNATVDVLGIPTAWIPWIIFPIKMERASGVLLPHFAYGGENGFEVGLPIFWAARHDVNVLVTPRYLTKRGVKPELTIETVYGERSETNLYGTYLRDQDVLKGFTSEGRYREVYDADRWAAMIDNDTWVGGDWRLRSDIKVVSDNEFVRDFHDLDVHSRDRFLESTLFGFGHFGPSASGGLVASVAYADDRQNPDFEDRDEFLLQRAPAAELAWLPTPASALGGLAFDVDVAYVDFQPYRDAEDSLDLVAAQIVGDDLFGDIGIAAIPGLPAAARFGAGDGAFQEGEPLADRGHRFTVNPHVGLPLRLFDAVDVRPQLGWQQTFYTTRAQDFAERRLVSARLDLSTRLVGTIDLPFLPAARHLLEPRLGWAFIEHWDQRGNPLFTPATAVPQRRIRQLSLDNVVLDDADRIETTNLVALGFGNRFYVATGEEERLRADVDLSVAYDFDRGSSGRVEQLIVEGRTFRESGVRTHAILAVDLDAGHIDQGLLGVLLPLGPDLGVLAESHLGVSYRYRRDTPLFYENFQAAGGSFDNFEDVFERISQVSVDTRLRLTERWAVRYETRYSFEKSLLLRNRGGVEYTSGCRCWAIQVSAEDDRNRGFQAMVNFTLLGFGQSVANPFAGGGMLGTGTLR